MMMKIIILVSIVAIVLASSAPMQDTIEERSGRTCSRNGLRNGQNGQPALAVDCTACEENPKKKQCIYCCCSDNPINCVISVEYKPAEPVYGK